jgi:ribosomal protein S18 acetylase RimI-like enzyme
VPSGFIYDLFVEEPWRGRGLAGQAMLALEERARQLGLATLYLHVFADNPVARALYDKLGYRVTSLNMAKPLSPG